MGGSMGAGEHRRARGRRRWRALTAVTVLGGATVAATLGFTAAAAAGVPTVAAGAGGAGQLRATAAVASAVSTRTAASGTTPAPRPRQGGIRPPAPLPTPIVPSGLPAPFEAMLLGAVTAGAPQVTADGPTGLDLTDAFSQYTNGDRQVVVAYVEGGINWHLPEAAHLVGNVYVDWHEVPVPCSGTTVADATMVVGGTVEPCHTVYSSDEADYDPDGSGVVNAAQWAHDPRVPLVDGTSYVNPEDLIAAFCGSGYDPPVDAATGLRCDISGWDFADDDPDPATEDGAYPHSDDMMENLLAQCPQCTIMPIKAGPEALDPTDDLAEAWLFACESGVSVIDSVTADLGYSSFMRQVISYCEQRGVVMVESSNDFDSTDQQGGMYWPDVVPGNGVVADAAGTAWVRSDETSWGPHNVVSVPGQSSTSGSTSALGGLFGLLLSWGDEAAAKGLIPGPLTGPEAVALMEAAAVPITDPTLTWPGAAGDWDLQYGYGVPDLDTAMAMVAADQLPPVVTIASPDWYQLDDPTRVAAVPVTGTVADPGGGPVTWVAQAAPGAQPAAGDWFTIGSGRTDRTMTGTLGILDLADIPASFWSAPFALSTTKELESTEQYTVTIRVVVTDAAGRQSQDRRAISVVHDPTWGPCSTMAIGSSGESQPALADLQGSGRLDIVFGTTDGTIDAIDPATCREIPGFPVHTAPLAVPERVPAGIDPGGQPIVADVAVGDLTGTGQLDVVATTLGGEVYAVDASGRTLPGWPMSANGAATPAPIPRPDDPYTRPPTAGAVAAPVLVHLAGPAGTLDVVQAGSDGQLSAWGPYGSTVPGWPVTVSLPADTPVTPGDDVIEDSELAATPTVAYLFGPQAGPDIVERSQFSETHGSGVQLGGEGFTFAYDAQGQLLPGWPVALPGLVEYYGSAQQFITEGSDEPAAADVTGTGVDDVEISSVFGVPFVVDGAGQVVGAYGSSATTPSAAVAGDMATVLGDLAGLSLPASPTAPPGLPADVPISFAGSGAFGVVGGSLRFAEAQVGAGSILEGEETDDSGVGIGEYESVFPAAGGAESPGFPSVRQGLDFLGAPLFADVGDGPAVDVVDGGDSNAIVAYDPQGQMVPGFPKWTPGWNLFSPTADDLLSDGRVDLVSTTREGYLMVWQTSAPASADDQWSRWHHDLYNSGNAGVVADPPGAPRDLQWAPGGATARFVAPGARWYSGQPSAYQVTGTLAGGATWSRREPATVPAGGVQQLAVEKGTRQLTVQAVGPTGLLGTPVSPGTWGPSGSGFWNWPGSFARGS